jgi:hypothetical protein
MREYDDGYDDNIQHIDNRGLRFDMCAAADGELCTSGSFWSTSGYSVSRKWKEESKGALVFMTGNGIASIKARCRTAGSFVGWYDEMQRF